MADFQSLSSAPGLNVIDAFQGAQRFGQQQDSGNIQNAMRLQQMVGEQARQQEIGRVRQIMESGAPPEKVIQALVSVGPLGATMAQHYAAALKTQQESQLRARLGASGTDLNNPDVLEQLGASGIPGFAHLTAKADRLRKDAADRVALNAMQGTEMPVNRDEMPAAATQGATDAALLKQFNSMPPGAKSVTALPAGIGPDPALAPTTKQGGAFAPLMQSEIPAIAQAASQLQEQVNTGRITAAQANTRLAQLEARQSAFETAQAGRQFTVDNRKEAPRAIDAVPEEVSHLHGAEYLATLPIGAQNKVKAVVEGRVPLTSFSVRNNERDAVIQMAQQYDPTFEAGKAPARAAIQKDFTSGPSSKNVTALNTAIAHLGTMDKLGEQLANGDVRAINAVANAMNVQLGKEAATNFSLAQTAVGDEMMRVFRQVGASEREAEDWRKKFNSANSPEQMKGALRTAGELLKGRIDALNDTWDRGMDTSGGYPKLLSDRSKAVMQSIGANVSGSQEPAAPAQYPTATAPNGRKVIFKDGRWQTP